MGVTCSEEDEQTYKDYSTTCGTRTTIPDNDTVSDDVYYNMGLFAGSLYLGLGHAADLYTEASRTAFNAIYCKPADTTCDETYVSDPNTADYTDEGDSSTEGHTKNNADDVERIAKQVMVKILSERDGLIQTQAEEIGRLRNQKNETADHTQKEIEEIMPVVQKASQRKKPKFAKPFRALSLSSARKSLFSKRKEGKANRNLQQEAHITPELEFPDSRNDDMDYTRQDNELRL